ncbi:uncharacterized protein METZ01_LOCUS201592 [marine metagenome]|uniref:Uncharacterized protein n=1 Tax=marine metagenome TaxID=408172 RepID=A0A382EDE6_9ZZZZ
MKHFKDFMKDIESSSEEETTEEEVETNEKENKEDKEEDADVKAEDYQDDVKAAWYKGDEAFADHKKANPQMHKKAPIRKKPTLNIPKGHLPKDKQEIDRKAFYKEK